MPPLKDSEARPVRPLARVPTINPKDVIGSDAALRELRDGTAAPAVAASTPAPATRPATAPEPGEEKRFLYDGASKGGKTLVTLGDTRYQTLVDAAKYYQVDQSVIMRVAFDAWLAMVGIDIIPSAVESQDDLQELLRQLVDRGEKWREDAEAAEEDAEAARRRALRNYRR